jgi:hypothetical protein
MKITERLAKLLEVKSIISLMVLAALTYGFVVDIVPVEVYAPIAMAIVTYFFTRKTSEEK